MTSKTKVYELAKQLGIDSEQIMDITQRAGINVKNSMSVLGSEEVRTICEYHDKNKALSKKVSTSPKGQVTEKRVGTGVIRRRARPSAPPPPKPAPPVVEVEKVVEEEAPKKPVKKAAEKKVEKKPGKLQSIIKRFKKEEPEAKEKKKAKPKKKAIEKAPEQELKKEEVVAVETPVIEKEATADEGKVTAALFEEKKRKSVPSIIKKVATEKHLSETVGPKLVIEKKPAKPADKPDGETPAGATPFKKVKEIMLVPLPTDSQREAGRRRLMRRQNTVFRSADYLKRELIHARKKKSSVSRVALKTQITTPAEHKRVVEMAERITVGDLSRQMGVKATQVIKKLMEMGVTANINENVDYETAALVGPEFSHEVKQQVFREEDYKGSLDLSAEKLEPRAPVVTIMGHVDHGKTSLLDHIRKTKVAESEAGGITQHIGAYVVKIPKKGKITFVDTPGHEAFTAMRARGAKVTDIVVLVVSAVDGVMPQTMESVDHAKAAKVPIVVAVNKMDLPNANPDKIRQTLSAHELAPEDWGGDTIYAQVSAKTGKGIDELLESILLQAEVMELKANHNTAAHGLVVESRVDKNRGCIATIILQHGKLRAGELLVAGTIYGKVRAMYDCLGKPVKEAGPGDPVEILGLPEAAPVGEEVFAVEDEKAARTLTSERIDKARELGAEQRPKMTVEEMLSEGEGGAKELKIILKADVQGSIEAIRVALTKIPDEKVKVKILHTSIGGITENDINLAVASKAVVFGFNVRPDAMARKTAETERVEVRTCRVIYELVDETRKCMEGMLDAVFKDAVIGHGEVKDTFTVPKVGTIAGSSVTDGKITRGCFMRLTRDSRIVWEGKISSLRRFKDDVKEVASGYECGIGFENFNDIKLGDRFEAYVKEEEKGTL